MSLENVYLRCAGRLAAGIVALPDKPEETVETTLHALWHLAGGKEVSAAGASSLPLPPLDSLQTERLYRLVEERLSGVPLAYLTGLQRFMGIDFLCAPGALIPRRETELLGSAALEFLRARADAQGTAAVLDVCTGSGNLALAMAHHEPRARVSAADLSGVAVALARRNAARLRLEARVEFREGDLLEPFDTPQHRQSFDLLLCNPPYISRGKVGQMAQEIAAHEPRLAFDGGPIGVDILLRLLRDAPRFLRPGGMLAFEVGAGQGSLLLRRLEQRGLRRARAVTDDAGQIRALLAFA